MMKKPDWDPTASLKKALTALQPTKTPVFNRPLRTEREHRLSRILHLILLSLLVILSIALISLKSMTLAFIAENADRGFTFDAGERDGVRVEPFVLAALPRNLYCAPAKLAIVAGVVAFSVGVTHVSFIVWSWRSSKKTGAVSRISYAFRRNTMLLHFSTALLVLFAMVSIFVTHRSTSHFREGYIIRQANPTKSSNKSFFKSSSTSSSSQSVAQSGTSIRYNIGRFDLETWSCELRNVDGASVVRAEYARQCGIEMAGRVLSVPFTAVAFLLASAMVVQMVRMRRDGGGERLRTEELELEKGRFNAI